MEKLTFNKTKQNQVKGILFSVGTLLMSVYLVYHGLKTGSIALPLIFGAFILLTARMLTSLIKNLPSVIVDEQGIKNNTNGMRLVPWEAIVDFEIKKAVNGKVLVIHLVDPDDYLKQVNRFARSIMKTNVAKLGSPVAIAENEFHEPIEDALDKIKVYRTRI